MTTQPTARAGRRLARARHAERKRLKTLNAAPGSPTYLTAESALMDLPNDGWYRLSPSQRHTLVRMVLARWADNEILTNTELLAALEAL